MIESTSLIDDCRQAYLDWCVDNGKLDVTLGSAKSSVAWQAWKSGWDAAIGRARIITKVKRSIRPEFSIPKDEFDYE